MAGTSPCKLMPVLIHPSVHLFHTPRQSREEKERGKERETKREKRECCPVYSLFLSPYLLN
jgi:hypothetical protein